MNRKIEFLTDIKCFVQTERSSIGLKLLSAYLLVRYAVFIKKYFESSPFSMFYKSTHLSIFSIAICATKNYKRMYNTGIFLFLDINRINDINFSDFV